MATGDSEYLDTVGYYPSNSRVRDLGYTRTASVDLVKYKLVKSLSPLELYNGITVITRILHF